MNDDYFESYPFADYYDDYEDDFDDVEDEWEYDCGYDPDFEGICHDVGTEDCSFFCPFHRIYFAKDDNE